MARSSVNRSGLRLKVTGDVVLRLTNIRALWLAIQNDPESTVHDVASEFYFAVGALFEGKSLDQIEFQKIDRARVKQHIKEG